jgi:hypothetical protein
LYSGPRRDGGLDEVFVTDLHQDHAELCPNRVGLREILRHLVRSGRSGNVVVSGFFAEQQIANAPANQISGVPLASQGADDLGGCLLHSV